MYYSTAQISYHLGVSQDTIRRWRTAGLIPAGRQVHQYAPIEWSEVDLETIRAYLQHRKTE